jgi:hypothetical protein
MKRYELKLKILDKNYVDTLIVSLVRQGYNVYYNKEEKVVCCTIANDELQEVNSI